MDNLFGGGGGDTVTTESTTSLQPWIEDILRESTNTAADLARGATAENRIAPFSNDQNAAMNYTRALANTAANPNTPSLTAYQGAHDLTRQATTNASRAAQEAAHQGQTTADDIRRYMNPYQEDVIDETMRGMRDRFGEAATDLASRDAAGHAFGGSRSAVRQAQMARDYVNDAKATEASLRSAGFDRASGLAEANNARETQARLNAAGLSLQGMGTAAGQYLQGLGGQEQAFDNMIDRGLRTTTALGGVGDATQSMDQRRLDLPFDTATWFRQFLPNSYPTTTTTTQPAYNNSGGMIGGALTAASLFL
ncbi:MAG: hypothetical protein JJ902_04070 [Roseibium sp.]|nr:hypothetical protein [Roseibium sp.]